MARKKKEETIKKAILDDLRALQNRCLINLKREVIQLRDSADQLLKKIEAGGTGEYFSSNHDCERYSRNVWSSCVRLSQIKKIEDDLLGTFDPKRLSAASKPKKPDDENS